ncbi:MAG: sugar kinase, partial [Opitutaceae bacterium]
MKYGLNLRSEGAIDVLSLGALVHRLDPGIIPFRKASHCDIHLRGGENNTSSGLRKSFGLNSAVCTAFVD